MTWSALGRAWVRSMRYDALSGSLVSLTALDKRGLGSGQSVLVSHVRQLRKAQEGWWRLEVEGGICLVALILSLYFLCTL